MKVAILVVAACVVVLALGSVGVVRYMEFVNQRSQDTGRQRLLVHQLFDRIRSPNGDTKTSESMDNSWDSVFLGASYKTELSTADLLRYYNSEFKALGWQPCASSRQTFAHSFFRIPARFDLSRTFYAKDPYEARLVFVGQSGEYSLALTWGYRKHCNEST